MICGNNSEFIDELKNVGDANRERCWHMPILPEHREELKGTRSDYKSTGADRYGGASTAAAFLELFIPKSSNYKCIVHLFDNTVAKTEITYT